MNPFRQARHKKATEGRSFGGNLVIALVVGVAVIVIGVILYQVLVLLESME